MLGIPVIRQQVLLSLSFSIIIGWLRLFRVRTHTHTHTTKTDDFFSPNTSYKNNGQQAAECLFLWWAVGAVGWLVGWMRFEVYNWKSLRNGMFTSTFQQQSKSGKFSLISTYLRLTYHIGSKFSKFTTSCKIKQTIIIILIFVYSKSSYQK